MAEFDAMWRKTGAYADGLISVSSILRRFPQLPHTTLPSAVIHTDVESHRAQAAVGSEASGRGSGGATAARTPPVATVTGSKVVPQPEHT